MGRHGTLVSEPKRDDSDIDASLQKVHRKRMANHVRENAALRQLGISLTGALHGEPQSLGHANTRERGTGATRKQRRISRARVAPQPSLELLRRIGP